ncbi:lasso RiPP family leader peptide-containing protein [Streptomyces marispadix]|uniref:Lasso RiPP family leader peptide-containing protein n=1 Tax=Streptomyces marispadix TaxID=2922868 RepID=A0ABS9SSG7_9ACTN|nr:lasso RiPP family leader peptide-containing protein [Streptomyces marispadix]MCH6159225.1 lasso RiPP family leader peptide-containing protein [Streptomyces marispadix]
MESQTLNIEPAEVYEAPLMVEAGDFADLTQGRIGTWPEGPVLFWA